MFKFSARTNVALKQNALHQFAMKHAITLYKSNSIYSFIPKNGCSTLRLSAAVANGCITGIRQGHWIHKNNQTFMPSLSEAVRADYKFVVLRCPFRRLASVFLDKFVAKEGQAWNYRDTLQRTIELDELTFADFVKSLAKPRIRDCDIHWKPQSSFLLYKEYDDYFSLENFSVAMNTLQKKIGFKVIDARPLTNHGLDGFEQIDGDFSNTSAYELALLKKEGKSPSHKSMYTAELIDSVKAIYEDDIILYKQKCSESDLMFRV